MFFRRKPTNVGEALQPLLNVLSNLEQVSDSHAQAAVDKQAEIDRLAVHVADHLNESHLASKIADRLRSITHPTE
jgi:hypothetical protein